MYAELNGFWSNMYEGGRWFVLGGDEGGESWIKWGSFEFYGLSWIIYIFN